MSNIKSGHRHTHTHTQAHTDIYTLFGSSTARGPACPVSLSEVALFLAIRPLQQVRIVHADLRLSAALRLPHAGIRFDKVRADSWNKAPLTVTLRVLVYSIPFSFYFHADF